MILTNTPFYKDNNLSELLKCNLYIKRDDLFPITGGGNKGRKADYILKKCINENCNAVVTCGGGQSNHVRAIAIRCCELGLKCTVVIHDRYPSSFKGNYLLLKQLGVKVVHCEQINVADVMDYEIDLYKSNGDHPFYIWGGGHCVEGSLAYYDAVTEIYKQMPAIDFDFVFHASGTGTTQAGLHCGFKNKNQNTKIIGISVARDQQRGKQVIQESVNELCSYLNLSSKIKMNITFDANYSCGGYEKTNDSLLSTINWAAEHSGLILDPTYSGKAFYALVDYIKKNKIKQNSNVIFWHTGGLLNLMSFKK